ncbi:hypothetical protein ACROYT_G041447 [Oculina patagonica]
MCGECLACERYVKSALDNRKSLDVAKREERRNPSSNYPIKYLSPQSKSLRLGNNRQVRSRMAKKIKKLYKQTRMELPQEQSSELCQLVEAIEKSNEGREELSNIFKEGNEFKDGKGANGKNGNRWSSVTVRVALAVYNRSPSAYEALRGLKILQLPHSKTLKQIIKDGSENAGIDEEYLLGQHQIYVNYQKTREEEGHPRPLGLGVMMWDEVKIQMKVAWNLKGAGITGFSASEDELKVLHDVFSAAVQSGAQKASYIVQFLWRDLTSSFDLVGPYFPLEGTMQSSALQEFLMLTLKALTSYGFKVSILLCDGASSNLTVLKLLSGHPRTQFSTSMDAETLRERYFVDVSFTNPEDPLGNPIFLMICPSHQLKNMIAALYSSRQLGTKEFTKDDIQFGWKAVETVFAQELERAENGLSRKVPGLKYAFVYRDNWTRLNVRPAKIMQQRFMIATVQDLAREANSDSSGKTAAYLDACNLLFEQGLLSRRRINNKESPVLANIRKGMSFFEEWCASHEDTVYADNSKKARQRKFLAWQTWDLLRLVVNGFLMFCDWFFDNVSPNGKYFISPLRINGSAIESIYSILKFASGGNLSALSYGPSLGKLINRKGMQQNKNSEKGYRDVVLNIGGSAAANVEGCTSNLVIPCQRLSNCHCVFTFPTNISQSTVGDRLGSNACTLIAVKFGAYCFHNKLDISLLWNQLPDVWVNSFVNAICDGNEVYDELYSDTAVYLDVEDVVNAVGDLFSIDSADQLFGFTNANEFQDLIDHINGVIQSTTSDHYGVIIACNMTVGFFIKSNGICAIIDSHQHVDSNGGAMIIMANNPKKAILEYSDCVMRNKNVPLDLGTLNWVKYS